MNRYIRPVILIGALTSGCDYFRFTEPRMDISITKEGDSYVISFRGCDGSRAGHGIEVPLIVMLEADGSAKPRTLEDEERSAYCQVRKQAPSTRNIKGSWHYGTTPPGYIATGCGPLQPGKAYELHAGRGYRQFRLNSTGNVQMGSGSCSN